jgi:hypothetical protein
MGSRPMASCSQTSREFVDARQEQRFSRRVCIGRHVLNHTPNRSQLDVPVARRRNPFERGLQLESAVTRQIRAQLVGQLSSGPWWLFRSGSSPRVVVRASRFAHWRRPVLLPRPSGLEAGPGGVLVGTSRSRAPKSHVRVRRCAPAGETW